MRIRGTVDSFKGTYGFIKPASGGLNVFVHQSNLEMQGFRQLFKGDVVEFEYESGDRGIKAVRVKLIEAAETAFVETGPPGSTIGGPMDGNPTYRSEPPGRGSRPPIHE